MAQLLSFYVHDETTPLVVISDGTDVHPHIMTEVNKWETHCNNITIRDQVMNEDDKHQVFWVSFDGTEDENGAFVLEPVQVAL